MHFTDKNTATERVYLTLKKDILQFALLPGTRLSENDVAAQTGVSRTPVREALSRLASEELVEIQPRVGWQVRTFDFRIFEELYDVRIALETAALLKLCSPEHHGKLAHLHEVWNSPLPRPTDSQILCRMDEEFHQGLIMATGNTTMAKMHADVSARIQLVRRLDFLHHDRVEATYHEHCQLLELIEQQQSEEACNYLVHHIENSKNQVRNLTMHMLWSAQQIAINNSKVHPNTITWRET